ncbi:UNVERIFIED_CONTAM: hypothetical protein HDU68_006915 [Siphonaria sp. JEL0065]|nr:hypothetical protein HDU68_006915 [Siphonaria sp. JEL0065]
MTTTPEAVRQQFRASLAELTFNSRPIIRSLTAIAGENIRFAGAIVQAIEDQLRNVAPRIKLPILYLLDSICKNVGPQYSSLFAVNMYATFTNAYAAVSLQDRERFKKVVGTWKLPDPVARDGRPLFPVALIGCRSPQLVAPVRPPQPQPHPGSQQSLTSIVLQQQIQALLTQKQNAVLQNPRDTASRDQIGSLTQLLVHVSSSAFSTSDLQLISQHLTSMMVTTTIPIPVAPIPVAVPSPAFTFPLPIVPSGLIPGVGNAPSSLLRNGGSHSNQKNNTNHFNSTEKKPVELIRLQLKQDDINRSIKNAHEILYDPSTLQCKQCGTRFPGTTDSGRKKNAAHLDWHFRQNKRLREKGGRRAVCREWYLGEETWVKEDLTAAAGGALEGDADEDKSKNSGAAFFGDMEDGTDAGGVSVVSKKKEPEIIHNIPAERETNLQCGICMETLEQYYDEQEDMWMIKNAVKVDGQIFHQSCYTMSTGDDAGGVSGKRKADDVKFDGKRIRA